MQNNAKSNNQNMVNEVDLHRTDRLTQRAEAFFWDKDVLVQLGQERISFVSAMKQLPASTKESFKKHVISFTNKGDYAKSTISTAFKAIRCAMHAMPPEKFDSKWTATALTNTSFHDKKNVISDFFLDWKVRGHSAITDNALRLLENIAPARGRPRNVLSDDPNKSWLTDKEYDALLSSVWENYDSGTSGTQVTLMKLLSMQYARRPVQLCALKVGDIFISDGSKSQGVTGLIINFPGAKDIMAEENFRDSKFEPHPLADHLGNLCRIQRQEVWSLYNNTLGFPVTEEQLEKLPFFCSKARIYLAKNIIENHLQQSLFEHLDSSHFHLRRQQLTRILSWGLNTPGCDLGENVKPWALRPNPPHSHRTNAALVVTATRLRHTRARQLARQDVPRNVLSHWLGHTVDKSLDSYYSDPAEQARQLDERMAPLLTPISMAFQGKLLDSEFEATRADDPTSNLEFAHNGELTKVGNCGNHSFCATTSIPIPCYRCREFEPLVNAPHQEVLEGLHRRQQEELSALKIGGARKLLIPIDLSADIRAVENCIARCNARKAERDDGL